MPIIPTKEIDAAIEQVRQNILMVAARLGADAESNNRWVGRIVEYNQQIAELARFRNTGVAENLSLAARSWLDPLPASVTKGT